MESRIASRSFLYRRSLAHQGSQYVGHLIGYTRIGTPNHLAGLVPLGDVEGAVIQALKVERPLCPLPQFFQEAGVRTF